jgi:hypothetical protein
MTGEACWTQGAIRYISTLVQYNPRLGTYGIVNSLALLDNNKVLSGSLERVRESSLGLLEAVL